MGLKDRILNTVARWFAPTMDHPAGGGMTGEEDKPAADAEPTESVDEEE